MLIIYICYFFVINKKKISLTRKLNILFFVHKKTNNLVTNLMAL
jgi:hypothetical protein